MSVEITLPPLFTVDKTECDINRVDTSTEVAKYVNWLPRYYDLLSRKSLSPKAIKVLIHLQKAYSNPMGGNLGSVYLARLRNNRESMLKVGISSNVDKRFETIPYGVNKLLVTRPLHALDVRIIEHVVLNYMAGERFTPRVRFSGWTECVRDTIENVSLIKSVINDAFSEVFIQTLEVC